MSAYAVLGGTGRCGTAIIENLLCTDDTRINVYCRNQTKLIKKVPQIRDNKRVKVYEGSIDDTNLLADCIRDTRAIFHCVTTNDNVPGYTTGLTAAQNIISALEKLKPSLQPGSKFPKIILLSSATIDDQLSARMPRWFRAILNMSASNVYEDLRQTEAFLRSQESLTPSIFIKPGGLSADVQRGHELNLEHDESFISYLDLAAGMIEAADSVDNRYDMKNVSVVNKNGKAKFPAGTLLCIATGLLRHLFPFLHRYLPATGPS